MIEYHLSCLFIDCLSVLFVVSLTGDICVNTLKKDWTPETTLKHVFQVIRCLLIVPFPESSLNDEAGKLFMESYEEFSRRARIMTDVHALEKENTESLNDDASVTSSGLKDGGSINKAKEAKKKNLKRL
jgi:ubiquitin-conjugating enzyme E2 S